MTLAMQAHRPIKLALVTARSPTRDTGGAERLSAGLLGALRERGFDVDQIDLPSFETSYADTLKSYLRFYDLDLSKYDGVISTKAPSYMVRHRNHVCYLPHTIRAYYDRFPKDNKDAVMEARKRTINLLDSAALKPPRLKALYCVGKEVELRLKQFINIDSEALHHPSTLHPESCSGAQYFFAPGRLHEWKRIDLVINAVRAMQQPYPLIISGTGEQEARLKELASDLSCVTFVGQQSDARLAQLYANATAVLFPTLEEDYGLVTVEAFASSKPVITCTDSGEPARLVSHGYNGFVCQPEATKLAKHLDWIAQNPSSAISMGEQAGTCLQGISWQSVCDKLLASLGYLGDD